MPIRLLAIDLDGTLLNTQREISAANRQALADASARAVQIAIVTGRRSHSARPLIASLPCPITLIASNGAWIGSRDGEAIQRDFLPNDVARQVLQAAKPFRPFAVAIYDQASRGQITMQEDASLEGPLGWYLRNNPDILRQVPDLPASITMDPIQIMFGGRPGRIEPLEDLLLASEVATRVHLTWTKYLSPGMSILDVMNKGCSKGKALKLWAEHLRIAPAEIMAIGDNYNDLEMLQLAGYPVVMGNCSSGLARDGWTLTLSNDQHGVAEAIRKYILI